MDIQLFWQNALDLWGTLDQHPLLHAGLGLAVLLLAVVWFGPVQVGDKKVMLDFMLGLKEGLEGHMKRVTLKVYLLTPNHVAVNNEDDEDGEATDDLLVRP